MLISMFMLIVWLICVGFGLVLMFSCVVWENVERFRFNRVVVKILESGWFMVENFLL